MADSAPAPEARVSGGDVPSRLQQALALLFPTNLAAKAVLFAVVVALLPLLPTSQAPRIWELPHILLLGLIISYCVFGQRNADAEVSAVAAKTVDDESVESYVKQMMQGPLVFEENDGGEADGAAKESVQAWSSQYFPDDPLVVVADADTGSNAGKGDASEKPLLLPVRKVKPTTEESATLTEGFSDGTEEEEEEEETEFLVTKARYGGVREHAIPSPSSVLDADLTLSPCSPPLLPPPPPPPPPPFLGHGPGLRKAKARSFNDYGRVGLQRGGGGGHNFRSKSATEASSSTFFTLPFDEQVSADDLEKKVAASDISSFSSDMVTDGEDDSGKDIDNYEEEEDDVEKDDDDGSCDEELFELATRPAPEEGEVVEDEVDRKADEFIAKFREQIRMQRIVEPGRR
ncbi:hypothetical protein E2562_039198 [Oryza meyeriana var. granulata]|uniref:DUF4408 domain-containing protein n=1 Tax=Oryza meyeriana var. granulata TaxID=110450 RepID=A0A6G1C3E8_9ORYZ|nr:hypothetical protein E2562_039198 [Oryza meyeriana var. granulata]